MPVMLSSCLHLPLVLAVFASAEASVYAEDANATSHVVKSHTVVATQEQSSIRYAPQKGQHFLNKHQLRPITSIDCLEQKRHHPDRPCSKAAERGDATPGIMNMGNFPHWKDAVCHSDGEFFCDPGSLLKYPEQKAVQDRLRLLKERTMVNCGAFEAKQDLHTEHWYDEKNNIHYGRLGLEDHRPFNLGVVIADEWPSNEMDPKSVEYFGHVVMAEWGLMPIYNGVDHETYVNQALTESEYFKNCPNGAMLFVIPKQHEAFLISPSCEFMCPSKGGPEIAAATLAGLDRGGIQEAVLAGIDEASRVLESTIAMSVELNRTAPKTRWRRSKPDSSVSDIGLVWVLRILYCGLILFGVGILGAFVYFVVVPQKNRSYRSYYSMMGQNGRRNLEEAYAEG